MLIGKWGFYPDNWEEFTGGSRLCPSSNSFSLTASTWKERDCYNSGLHRTQNTRTRQKTSSGGQHSIIDSKPYWRVARRVLLHRLLWAGRSLDRRPAHWPMLPWSIGKGPGVAEIATAPIAYRVSSELLGLAFRALIKCGFNSSVQNSCTSHFFFLPWNLTKSLWHTFFTS